MKFRALFFPFFLLLTTTTIAQDKYVSCHHTKKAIDIQPLTEAQRNDMTRNVLRSDTFDILHYDIHLDVRDYDNAVLIANTIITYAPKMADVTSITLDLQQLTVDSITSLGVVLDYAHEGSVLQVDLLSPTVVGEEAQISVWYHGTPYLDPNWGGFYFQGNYIYNLGIGISTIPPNFGKVWYPCFDTYVERATYDYYVTSDNGWKAYCQGQLVAEDVIDDETVMRHYSLDKPIPTYLSAIAVADYESYEYIHQGVNGDVPVRLTSKPIHQNAMQNKFAELGSSIDALEYWYGPEYWGQIGYVITVDGAMEHPTNIAYPQALLSADIEANQDLLTHELGHHWWGNMVSQANYNHMWVKEGTAEYSVHLMREWIEGSEAYLKVVKDNHMVVIQTAHLSDEGYQVLAPIADAYIYGVHSYKKGASVMHSMRAYLGDSLFRQGLQFVLDSTLNSTIDSEKFRDVLSIGTGVDLTDFFDDWIFKPGFSSFEINTVNVVEDNGMYAHTVEIEQKLRECPSYYHNVPLEISAWDANYQPHDFQITASGEFSSAEFVTDFEPVFYTINTRNKLNLAKLDYNQPIVEETNMFVVPYASFKLKVAQIGDSANVYVEHQMIMPDQNNLADNIDEISSTHYWIVNGNWDENTTLQARLNYHGSAFYHLDVGLYGDTEEGAMVVYRSSPEDMWVEYPYYTLYAGSLTNGNGSMKLDSLIRGEYTFAKGSPMVGIQDHSQDEILLEVSPNPVKDLFTIRPLSTHVVAINLLDNHGRLVKNWTAYGTNQQMFDVTGLSTGSYYLQLLDNDARVIGREKLIVVD